MPSVFLLTLLFSLGLLGSLAVAAVRRPRLLHVNPRYRTVISSLGLREVEHFLELRAVIVSGHPDRNVSRLTLGGEVDGIAAYLKREHRVHPRDYLSSFLAGFGLSSRSVREARMLEALRQAGVRGPEVIAAGEDGHGRAFLLVRALTGTRELRELLREPHAEREDVGQVANLPEPTLVRQDVGQVANLPNPRGLRQVGNLPHARRSPHSSREHPHAEREDVGQVANLPEPTLVRQDVGQVANLPNPRGLRQVGNLPHARRSPHSSREHPHAEREDVGQVANLPEPTLVRQDVGQVANLPNPRGLRQVGNLPHARRGPHPSREHPHAEREAYDTRVARVAWRLGRAVGRMHAAGFHHADLHASHVLVGPDGDEVAFLDWQRSQRVRRLGWRERVGDLAALDATLAHDLAGPRERLLALRAYLKATAIPRSHDLWPGKALAARIRRRAARLLRKRYVRELRDAPLRSGEQSLIWLDGEALCVTQEYYAELNGVTPQWLLPVPPRPHPRHWVARQALPHGDGRTALLTQRSLSRPWSWLWARLRGRPFTTPELRQAAILFRLQRYAVPTPRLLAVGQRFVRPWRTESFVLIEPEPGTGFTEWLAQRRAAPLTEASRKGQHVFFEMGRILRRLHDSGCYLAGRLPFKVRPDGSLTLAGVDELLTRRRSHPALARDDLRSTFRTLSILAGRRSAVVRFLRGYEGTPRPGPATKKLFRALSRPNE